MNPANVLRFGAKSILFETPLARFIGPRYAFNFAPAQLAFLCSCLDATASISGCVVEAGCFAGGTTVFLNAHMTAAGIEKPYYAIDTFSGFVGSQTEHEVVHRKKRASSFSGFALNSQRWFDRSMQVNGINRVTSIQADIATFNASRLGPIAFGLLDVDLYIPTRVAIPRIYKMLAPGGILVVDDCKPDNIFDGANQAYTEALRELGLEPEIHHGKLGVIKKP